MPISTVQNRGKSFPLGATLCCGGADFSVFANTVERLSCCCSIASMPEPSRVLDLDPHTNHLPLLAHIRAWRNRGPALWLSCIGAFRSDTGLRFDPDKVLLDPYGNCIARPAGRSREAARQPGDNAATALKSVVVDPNTYDWEGDTRDAEVASPLLDATRTAR